MARRIKFLDTKWGSVAYTIIGDGSPLVFDTGWFSDLDVMWSHPGYRAMVESLAESYAVICFDSPGSGLSDRTAPLLDLGDDVELLGTVVEAAGGSPVDKTSLFCSSMAASAAIRYAARRPEMVEQIIAYGATASGAGLAPPDVQRALVDLIRAHWGLGSRAVSDLFVPGIRGEDLEWFVSLQQRAASADHVAGRLEMYYATDVTGDAGRVQAPTLVLHRSGDRAIPLTQATQLAGLVPTAELEVLDGAAHPPYLGDWQSVLAAVLRFLATPPASGLPSGPYGELTARELDVAAFVVDGLTNAQIGARLGISPRTVETHLTRVRHKLGVGTRAEIAVWISHHHDP